jgi:hypothetical protein
MNTPHDFCSGSIPLVRYLLSNPVQNGLNPHKHSKTYITSPPLLPSHKHLTIPLLSSTPENASFPPPHHPPRSNSPINTRHHPSPQSSHARGAVSIDSPLLSRRDDGRYQISRGVSMYTSSSRPKLFPHPKSSFPFPKASFLSHYPKASFCSRNSVSTTC